MAKRRTSGIQRRSRASEAALGRRVGEGGGLDVRLLAVGGILVIGLVVLAVVLMFSGGGQEGGIGQRMPLDGAGLHIPACQPGNYSSVPATSGCHRDTPAAWGVYSSPQDEVQLIHNLEHGGIVIWYQADRLDAADIAALEDFTRRQLASDRWKVILSPWNGEDFDHPIAVSAWSWLLYLDEVDTDQIRRFFDDHYLKEAPEPGGGPGRPAV